MTEYNTLRPRPIGIKPASTARKWCGTSALAIGMVIASTGASISVSAQEVSAGYRVDEIVVTSRKRSETMMDVPMSINVVSSDTIEKLGAEDYTDLLRNVPSLTAYQNGPGRTRISIRGVANGGGNDNDTQNQETVGIYLDEIPISMGAMNPEFNLFDLKQVEVLRGPQGTLYGAGSMTGTIRLVTNEPELTQFSGKVEASASTISKGGENYSLKGLANVPIIEDKVGIRASAYYGKHGGYIDNITTGAEDVNDGDQIGGRITVRAKPTDNLTIDLSVLHHDYSDNGRPEDAFSTPELSRDYTSFDGYDDEMQIYNLSANYDLGWAELVSTTSVFERTVVNRRSLDLLFAIALPPGITPHELVDTTETDIFVQELRLASTSESNFQWTIGAYADRKDTFYLNTFPVPGADAVLGTSSNVFGAPTDNLFYGYDDLTVETYALFGEAYYTLGDFTVTGGLRYFNWKQDISYYQSGLFNGEQNSDTPPAGQEDGINPKVNVSYDVNDDFLIYAQAARGFRYGGINGTIPRSVCEAELAEVERSGGDTRFFDADKTWNYEIGGKGTIANGRANINATYFHVKWDDMQTSRSFECGFGFRENVGKATSQGIELEIDALLTDNLRATIGGAYINSELDQDVVNLSAEAGDKAPFVPEFAFNASLDYDFAVTDSIDGFAWGNIQYVGERNTEFDLEAANNKTMEAYTVANLRLGIDVNAVELSIFANNIFDSRGVVRALGRPPFDPDAAIVVQPRTVGVSARHEF